MSVNFEADVSRGAGNFVCFPEELIIDPELNGRHDDTTVEELAADIEKEGQIQAVICRKNDDGQPVLVFGHRRFRAISLLNERNPNAKRKIRFEFQKLDEMQAFTLAIKENRFRKEVSAVDDATNIEIMRRRFNASDQDLIGIYFPEAKKDEEKKAALKWIKDREQLTELSVEAAQAVRDGRVKITAAVALSKLTKTQQREKLKAKGQGRIQGKDVKPSKAKSKPTPAKKPDNVILQMVNSMLETIEEGEIDSDRDWISVQRLSIVELRDYVASL